MMGFPCHHVFFRVFDRGYLIEGMKEDSSSPGRVTEQGYFIKNKFMGVFNDGTVYFRSKGC